MLNDNTTRKIISFKYYTNKWWCKKKKLNTMKKKKEYICNDFFPLKLLLPALFFSFSFICWIVVGSWNLVCVFTNVCVCRRWTRWLASRRHSDDVPLLDPGLHPTRPLRLWLQLLHAQASCFISWIREKTYITNIRT